MNKTSGPDGGSPLAERLDCLVSMGSRASLALGPVQVLLLICSGGGLEELYSVLNALPAAHPATLITGLPAAQAATLVRGAPRSVQPLKDGAFLASGCLYLHAADQAVTVQPGLRLRVRRASAAQDPTGRLLTSLAKAGAGEVLAALLPGSEDQPELRVLRDAGATVLLSSRNTAGAVVGLLAGGHSPEASGTKHDGRQEEWNRRQTFLLRLSDALRPLADPVDIQMTACRVLGEHTGVSRVFYGDVTNEQEVVIRHNYVSGVPPLIARLNAEEFGLETLAAYKRGEKVVFSDLERDPRFSEVERRSFAAINVAANASLGLLKGGRWVAAFGMHSATPRAWTDLELELLEETAERTWAAIERARAEQALRQSEEKFRRLFETIDEGFCVIEVFPDERGRVADLTWLEANPAFDGHTGMGNVIGRRANEVLPRLEGEWLDLMTGVYQTGIPARTADYSEDLDRWLNVYYSRVGGAGSPFIAAVFSDVSLRKRAEITLRESEERQAFLLRLSDILRAEPDADAVAALAVRMLADELRLDRCYIVARRLEEDLWDVGSEFRHPDLPGMPPVLDQREFPESLRLITHGTLVFDNAAEQPGMTDLERKGLQALGFGGLLMAVLREGERNPAWSLVAASTQPRHWTSTEIKLVEEVAERTWAAIERAKAEAALRESEEQYRTLFETMDEGFALCEIIRDEEGNPIDYRYLEVNSALGKQSGLATETVVGKQATEVFPDLDRWLIRTYGQVVDTQQSIQVEHFYPHVNIWFRLNAFPRGGERFAVLFANITGRKQRELSAALLDEIGKDLSILSAPDEIMQAVGKRLGEFLELSGCYFVDVDEAQNEVTVHHGWASENVPSLMQTFNLGDYLSEDFVRTMRAGEVFVMRDTAQDERADAQSYARLQVGSFVTVPFFRNGRYTGHIAVTKEQAHDWREDEIKLLQEISGRIFPRIERARAEEALTRSEGRLRALIENLPGSAAFVVDHDLRFLLAQGEALMTAGVKPEDLTGLTVAQALPPELAADTEAHYRRALAGEEFDHEHQTYGRVFITRGVPLRSAAGDIYAALAVSYDITERKRAEEALRVLNATLEERVAERTRRIADLNTELGSFIRRTAHNLEAPARALAELLDPTRPDADALLAYDPVLLQDELHRLNSVADTFQRLSRLEQGELHLEPVALGELMQELQRQSQAQFPRVNWTVPPLPIVRADRALLRQALENTLEFSLSPTRATTHLEISAQEDDAEVRLHFWDDGLGLSAEEASTLFDLAVRSDQAVPLLPSGGLAQVRRILARHGGWAWAESHLRGGKLTLALPRDAPTRQLDQLFNDLPG